MCVLQRVKGREGGSSMGESVGGIRPGEMFGYPVTYGQSVVDEITDQ